MQTNISRNVGQITFFAHLLRPQRQIRETKIKNLNHGIHVGSATKNAKVI